MAKNTFTTAFNRSVSSIKDSNVVKFTAPNKVKKSLSYATDINKIYEQYCRTGHLPLNGQQPIYDENFVAYNDLISAQKLVDDATKYFVGLPANIKNQYGNSLSAFVKALNEGDKFLIDNGVLHINKPNDIVIDKPIKESVTNDTITPQPSTVNANPENAVNTATTD